MNFDEPFFPFRAAALAVIAAFYAVYFIKAFAQKRRGIKTRQIGSRKEKGLHTVETLMSAATLGIVFAQIFSICAGWNYLPEVVRYIGLTIGIIGDAVFLAAVLCMKDSWRAGIPEKDKTKLVTGGIYKISRNPAFLGFDLSYTGMLLLYFNPLLAAFTVFAVVMLHLQILQEEKFMKATFGTEYCEYKARVCRYLGIKPRKKTGANN